MEDENGLELSLGLSFGGSTAKVKDKDGSSSDAKSEEGNNDKGIGDLRNFLNTGIPKRDTDDASRRNDLAPAGFQTSQENFFTNLTKSASTADASKDIHGSAGQPFTTRYGGLWDANNKSSDVEEVKSSENDMGKWLEGPTKHKRSFEEMNNQKKHEREVKQADALGRSPSMATTSVKPSHVSATTEEGSTAENEDVAESEIEGSTSRLVHHDEGTKNYLATSGCSSEATKDSQGHRQSNAPPRNEPKLGNLTFGTSMPLMSEGYSLSSKVPSVNGESNSSGFPLHDMMQLIPPKSNEGSGSQTMNPGNLPLTFGYPPVQLPTLDTGRSWNQISHPQQLPPSFLSRSIVSVVPNSDRSEDGLKMPRGVVVQAPHSMSEPLPDERKTAEATKGGGKQHATVDGGTASASHIEGNRPKEAYHNQAVDGLPREVLGIRAGIATELKIGGSGSLPDLPWVSTTGPGPNGKTISGVTYRLDKYQIKIVCACHGSHMTPEEFVQHASADHQNPANNTGLPSFSSGNPAASARN